MRWLRSVVAVGAGLIVVVALYLWSGRLLGPLILHWIQPYEFGDDSYSPQGELIARMIAIAWFVVLFIPGGFLAALLAPAHRFKHGMAVGVTALSITAALWLTSPTPLEWYGILASAAVLAGCGIGAIANLWLVSRLPGVGQVPVADVELSE
jgi:hypothetical protein